jgi:hypothetical protein
MIFQNDGELFFQIPNKFEDLILIVPNALIHPIIQVFQYDQIVIPTLDGNALPVGFIFKSQTSHNFISVYSGRIADNNDNG